MFNITLADLIARFIVLFISVGVHEFGHAYAAYLMGDPTAKEQGRMTLNPLPNIWWPGFLIAMIGGPAILGSAPVNPYRMRNPRWGGLIAVAAGPLATLLLAAIAAVPLRLGLVPLDFGGDTTLDTLVPTPGYVVFLMVFINAILFFVNLLPLYPIDGWRIVLSLLPPRPAIWWERNQTNSMYVLFGLIILSFLSDRLAAISDVLGYLNILHWLVEIPALELTRIFIGV